MTILDKLLSNFPIQCHVCRTPITAVMLTNELLVIWFYAEFPNFITAVWNIN
jgi:hypothetical protein